MYLIKQEQFVRIEIFFSKPTFCGCCFSKKHFVQKSYLSFRNQEAKKIRKNNYTVVI